MNDEEDSVLWHFDAVDHRAVRLCNRACSIDGNGHRAATTASSGCCFVNGLTFPIPCGNPFANGLAFPVTNAYLPNPDPCAITDQNRYPGSHSDPLSHGDTHAHLHTHRGSHPHRRHHRR